MSLSRRVASGRSGECATEWRLTIDGLKYEGWGCDCGVYMLLLLYMLLRVEFPCVVARTSQRVQNLVSRLQWWYSMKAQAQTPKNGQ